MLIFPVADVRFMGLAHATFIDVTVFDSPHDQPIEFFPHDVEGEWGTLGRCWVLEIMLRNVTIDFSATIAICIKDTAEPHCRALFENAGFFQGVVGFVGGAGLVRSRLFSKS